MTYGTEAIGYMVERILYTYENATADQYNQGINWYPAMKRVMDEHSHDTGLSSFQCAAVYAACSINNFWSQNLVLASRALDDVTNGVIPFENGGTLSMIIKKVRDIVKCHPDDTQGIIDALVVDKNNKKIVNFTHNLAGFYSFCTVDRWATEVATGDHYVPSGKEYDVFNMAYDDAAQRVGVNVATLQAITWCVIRKDGK